jgi:hypothetical protein
MPMITFMPKHFAEVNFNAIPFPESEDDMPTDTTTEVSPRTLSVNVTPAVVKVRPGQELIFTNDPSQFPEFEIKFLRASPGRADDILTGTDTVVIHVVKAGVFPYVIIHTSEEGDPVPTGAFSVRSCTGGCP